MGETRPAVGRFDFVSGAHDATVAVELTIADIRILAALMSTAIKQMERSMGRSFCPDYPLHVQDIAALDAVYAAFHEAFAKRRAASGSSVLSRDASRVQ